MNILFFGSFSFRNGGGVGRVSRTLAKEFVRQGHSCCFLAAAQGVDHDVEGVPQLFLPGSPGNLAASQRYVARVVQEQQVDLIINQTGFNPEKFALLADVVGRTLVLTVHHNCVACLQDKHESIIRNSIPRYKLPTWLLPAFIFNFLKERSRRRTGRSIEKIAREGDGIVLLAESFLPEIAVFTESNDIRGLFAIPNPSPFVSDESALLDKEKRLLYVGRLENGQKRVDRLLAIWAELCTRFPDWRLDIVGDGRDRSELQAQVCSRGLPRVYFHGETDPESFYRRASILLLPSDFEGFGMVLIEAQAFGCIPIVSDCFSSVREVVLDGETGFVVPPADINSYVQVASGIMRNSESVSEVRLAALRHAVSFEPRRIAGSWLRIAEELIEQKKRSVESAGSVV